MKRILICLLVALLLSSCGTTTKDPETTAQDNTAHTTADVSTETTEDALFRIAKENNGGKTFTILTTEEQRTEYDAEELTGDIVNDAVHDRNIAVEDLLGIDFQFVYKPGAWADKDSYCQTIQNSVMAADGAYDIVSGMISCVQPIASTQLFLNVYDVPGIDLSNPWWVSELQNSLTINGKLFGFIGDMSLSMYTGLSVIFANLNLLEDIGATSPYELVMDSEWTLDKMIEMSSGVGQDLNGDGKYTLGDDLYGMVLYEVPYRSLQASLDIKMVSMDENGLPTVNPISDKLASAVEKLTGYLKNADVYREDFNGEKMAAVDGYFSSDKILFYMTKLERLNNFRDMESDYAILPFPKYDTDQEKYYTVIATGAQMIFIPTTTPDVSLVGKVCEAMSYYSYKNVVPAYYDVTLKNKYSRDENTQIMLDIIREGAVMPFEYAYSTMIGGSTWLNTVLSSATAGNGNVASMLASTQSSWESSIEKMLEAFMD